LGLLPLAAHAQHIPLWVAAGVLSPFLVIALCFLLGWLARSLRVGLIHTGLVIGWVLLFLVASYYVTNDYVIWTPLALYLLHTGFLLVLIVVQIARRWSGK